MRTLLFLVLGVMLASSSAAGTDLDLSASGSAEVYDSETFAFSFALPSRPGAREWKDFSGLRVEVAGVLEAGQTVEVWTTDYEWTGDPETLDESGELVARWPIRYSGEVARLDVQSLIKSIRASGEAKSVLLVVRDELSHELLRDLDSRGITVSVKGTSLR